MSWTMAVKAPCGPYRVNIHKHTDIMAAVDKVIGSLHIQIYRFQGIGSKDLLKYLYHAGVAHTLHLNVADLVLF